MSALNKVMLIGHVGKDPVIRNTKTGEKVANFSLATSTTYTDKGTQEKIESTEWHQIVIFGKLADIVAKWVTKGKLIYLEGHLKTEKWTDKNQTDHFTTKINAYSMQFLGKNEATGDKVIPTPTQKPTSSNGEDYNDDIPF